MSKGRTRYVCRNCGASFMRWAGRCSTCGEWNTLSEEPIIEAREHVRSAFTENAVPLSITTPGHELARRIVTGNGECDRVLGGGLVPGSLVLIGGDPGIGKSTLMLQIAHHFADHEGKVLYVSGEESFDQTHLRAARLGRLADRLFVLTENEVTGIRARILEEDYSLVVVDSIQSVYSAETPGVPGSMAQVRECANEFLRLSKGRGVPTFLVGHVTKDGAIAGPRLLEHLVDTVLYFEGEGRQALRILRAVKNRFGSTNEIGVFEMTEKGLVEVPNPSALFLCERPEQVSGSVVIPSIEGTRPVLVEVQALIGESSLGAPRRTVTGVNPYRVSLILAVLEKRAGMHFSDKDVFVNVVGGVHLEEPATDLAVALALVSSLLEKPLSPTLVAFGEVGLAGEVRAVGMARQRLAEASKFGFTSCILPKGCTDEIDTTEVALLPVSRVMQAIERAV